VPLCFQVNEYITWYSSIKRDNKGFHILKQKESIFFRTYITCLNMTYLCGCLLCFQTNITNIIFSTSLLFYFFSLMISNHSSGFKPHTTSNQLCIYMSLSSFFFQSKYFVDTKKERSKRMKKKMSRIYREKNS